jgi:predicted homoserine dehydrogenase-like protein
MYKKLSLATSIYKLKKCFKSGNIKNVGIVGSGQMGTGIAYVFARYFLI